MFRCEAREVMRNEAYFSVRCNDKRRVQRSRWTLLDSLRPLQQGDTQDPGNHNKPSANSFPEASFLEN